MRALGRRLAGLLRAGDLVVLSGGLGAGKTTLVQGLADGLGVRGPVTSPTFVISRVHPSLVGGPALVHVDAYRVGGLGELDDLDLDTSLDEAVTVVEWGSGLVEDLAASRLEVELRRRTGHAAAGPGGGADEAVELDEAAELDEPRRVVLRGVGERWRGVQLPGA
ncbi:tRNA (adenosine(37)-N6)-threonylcarbamoyltransferase complex ATPase subunit type 1 TsaE [Kineococcus glutinatus]